MLHLKTEKATEPLPGEQKLVIYYQVRKENGVNVRAGASSFAVLNFVLFLLKTKPSKPLDPTFVPVQPPSFGVYL